MTGTPLDAADAADWTGSELAPPIIDDACAAPRPHGRFLRASSIVAALLLHGGALYAIINAPNEPVGGGGAELDAIEVTIVSSKVLESRALAGSNAAARSDAPLRARVGSSRNAKAAPASVNVPSAAAARQNPAPGPAGARRPKREPTPTKAIDKARTKPKTTAQKSLLPVETIGPRQAKTGRQLVEPQSQPRAAETAPAKISPAEPSPGPRIKPITKTAPPKIPKPNRIRRPKDPRITARAQAPAALATKGGASARSRDAAARQNAGTATASPGARNAFATKLRKALSANAPDITFRGEETGGEVTVIFAVTPDGKLRYARILRSSGKAYLDSAALGAVRNVTLPRPPAGMTPAQLTYEVPYRFGG